MAVKKTIGELNALIEEIQGKLGTIREFEAQYNSITSGISTVEIAPLKIASADIEIDVSSTLRNYRDKTTTRGGDERQLSRYEAIKRLNQVLVVAEKYASYAGTGSASNRRTTLTAEILAATRDSERYKAMADSASTNRANGIEDEEDFFYRTVADAINNVNGIDASSMITQLNSKLKQQGYNDISKKLLSHYTQKKL